MVGMVQSTLAAHLFSALLWMLGCGLTGCGEGQRDAKEASTTSARSSDEERVESFAREVVSLIAERRIEELAQLAHPRRGVLFSPCVNIDKKTAITLTGLQLSAAWRNNKSFTWGHEDGSGEPIVRTTKGYFDEFVYGADYLNADEVAVNKPLGQGNSKPNIQTLFPDAVFVEFHFAGFSPQFQGLDWRSLRILLEKNPDIDSWWVVAIVNDQWTI